MSSFLRRTVPAALFAGGAMMLATAGTAGAQVPVPAGDLPTGGVDSLSGAPSALCSGPLAALGGASGVCEVAGEDQIQVGDSGQVLPQAGLQDSQESQESQASSDQQYPVNVNLNGDEEPVPDDCGPDGDCDVPEEPCEECPPTTDTTVPTTQTTVPPETTTTVPEAPPTSQVAAQPPAQEELPRTGSTVAPYVAGAAALLAVGAGLVAARRFALDRRG